MYLLSMEQRGQGLIDQEAQRRIQQALQQGEGRVECDQAAEQSVDGRQGERRAGAAQETVEGLDNLLIHADDDIDGQELGVDRVRTK